MYLFHETLWSCRSQYYGTEKNRFSLGPLELHVPPSVRPTLSWGVYVSWSRAAIPMVKILAQDWANNSLGRASLLQLGLPISDWPLDQPPGQTKGPAKNFFRVLKNINYVIYNIVIIIVLLFICIGVLNVFKLMNLLNIIISVFFV